jgi:iron complex transport system ATP-binding protein
MLEWRDVTVVRDGVPVVRHVSLAMHPGQLVALVGPNGAGKSTLVRAMTGEWPLAAGEVRLFGRPLADWDRTALARCLGVLPQQSTLAFDFLVEEVVALGRLPRQGGAQRDADVIRTVLDEVGLPVHGQRRYLSLSAGEQQRVHLARVLAQLHEAASGGGGPAALLLDEPTSALDLGHQKRLLDLVWHRSRQGFAAGLVLHDLNLALRYADRMVLLVGGKVMADGTPAEVARPSLLSQAYGCDVSVRADADGAPWVSVAGPMRR